MRCICYLMTWETYGVCFLYTILHIMKHMGDIRHFAKVETAAETPRMARVYGRLNIRCMLSVYHIHYITNKQKCKDELPRRFDCFSKNRRNL